MKFQLLKTFLAIFIPVEFGILFKKLVQGFSNLGKVFNEPSVEACMTKELSNCFHICGRLQLGNNVDFGFINFNSSARYYMPQYNSLVYHKMALLPIKHQILLYAPLQDGLQIG